MQKEWTFSSKKDLHLNFNALVFFDDESQKYVAHCLELNIVAEGDDKEEASDNLVELVTAQIKWTDENDNWDHLFRPAPLQVWAEFYQMSGKKAPKPEIQRRRSNLEHISKKKSPLDIQLAYH